MENGALMYPTLNLQMPAFCGSRSLIFLKYVWQITEWEDS